MNADRPSPETHATTPIRVAMPHQLRSLARVTGEVAVEVPLPATVSATLDALEAAHPSLVGTIRDRVTGRRRPMIRVYADGEDLSDVPVDTLLPDPVAQGCDPLRLVGAISGG